MTIERYEPQDLVKQNMRLARELKQRIDQLAAMGTVAAAVSQSLDLNQTLNTALQAVLDVVGAEAGGISLIDLPGRAVVLRAQLGWTNDFVTQPMRIPFGQGMSGQVLDSDAVIVNNDLRPEDELAVPSFHNENFRSIVMSPMHARGGIVGILSIMSLKPNNFDPDTVEVLRAIADTVGVALDNARLYETSLENQSRLSAVLHSTADGIIATDQNGRISLVNQAAAAMLELGAADLIGTPLRAAPIHASIRNSLLFALSSRAEHSPNTFQVTLDNERILSALVSPVVVESQVDQMSMTDGWVIVLQDVTHLRQAEAARAQFIQAAAHDMRNPLSVAMNALDLLTSMVGEYDDAREMIDVAMHGVTRIQVLIDDLLNLEHIESGYGFRLTATDIGDLINEVCAETHPLLVEKALALAVEIPHALPRMMIDRRWVSRAILNYVDNAVKYTHGGGHVTLRAFVNAPMLHIEVSDDGIGVPVEAQPRLFERFYRVEGLTVPGSGLGLAIVKSVAEAHGGTVYIQSRPGQGSTFGMTLLIAD